MKKYDGHYKDGKRDGYWETYFKDGQLKTKGHYKDWQKDGLWEYFNKDGTKRFTPHKDGYDEGTGTYKDGKKVSD